MSALDQISSLNEKIGVIQTQGDATAMTAFYIEDSVLLPPNAPRVEGLDAIRRHWEGGLKNVAHFTSTTISVTELSSAYLQELGKFRTVTKAPNEQILTGKYLVIWKKVGNDWKILSDVWNGD